MHVLSDLPAVRMATPTHDRLAAGAMGADVVLTDRDQKVHGLHRDILSGHE